MKKLSFVLVIIAGLILGLSPGYCADVAVSSTLFSKPLGTKEKTIGTNTTLIPYCAIDGSLTTDTELSASAASADGTANPTAGGALTYSNVFNSITWDRIRSVANGQDSTGTGILASGILGQLDDVATGAVTENNFSPLRLSTRRALLIEGVASGTAVGVSGTVTANAGTGTFTVDSELTTSDLDTGAGTDTKATVGLSVAKSGGSSLVGAGAAGDALPTDVETIAAGTNRIGGAYWVSGNIIDENGVSLTVKRAFANVAASATDSNIVTAVASKKIRVLSVIALAGGTATNLTFNSKPAGAGTAITPLLANAANGGEVLPPNPYGWFETTAGEGLTVTTGAGSTTGILVIYVEV